jgi:undecaprenyl diphosphate synthase
MNMYKQIDGRLDEILSKNQINFKWIGNPAGVSDGFRNYLDEKSKQYSFDTNKWFVFAVNYGGRDEIVRGIHKLAEEGKDLTTLTEEDLTPALDLGNVPPIELVIRTK